MPAILEEAKVKLRAKVTHLCDRAIVFFSDSSSITDIIPGCEDRQGRKIFPTFCLEMVKGNCRETTLSVVIPLAFNSRAISSASLVP